MRIGARGRTEQTGVERRSGVHGAPNCNCPLALELLGRSICIRLEATQNFHTTKSTTKHNPVQHHTSVTATLTRTPNHHIITHITSLRPITPPPRYRASLSLGPPSPPPSRSYPAAAHRATSSHPSHPLASSPPTTCRPSIGSSAALSPRLPSPPLSHSENKLSMSFFGTSKPIFFIATWNRRDRPHRCRPHPTRGRALVILRSSSS